MLGESVKSEDVQMLAETTGLLAEAIKQTAKMKDGAEKSSVHLANIGALFSIASKYSALLRGE